MIDLLADLGGKYRRVREEHDRSASRSALRRRLKQDMKRLAERFERVLELWVSDESLRHRWRAYLHHGAEQPDEPRFTVPPLFRGRAETGAMIEVRPATDGGYDILLDSALAKHDEIPWHLEQEQIDPIQIGEWSCQEIFTAPDEAIAALDAFLSRSGATPSSDWAQVLLEDGLIDGEFGLTPRGGRALARRHPAESSPGGKLTNVCVLLASAARGRVLILSSSRSPDEPTLAMLEEVADKSNAEARARDSEQFTDSRPGIRREGAHGPRHGVNDRRQSHRENDERQFLELVVEEAAPIWQQFPTCTVVVVANPRTLGQLRPVLARHVRDPYELVEFPRDLTRLTAPAVHDALAKADILPPRGRRAPVFTMRTPNPWQEGG